MNWPFIEFRSNRHIRVDFSELVMVVHVDGGPHDTVRCYFTTFSHELPVFPYEGRRCSNYYVTGYERAGHAVRKLHTNSGLMHPSASTSNDEKNNYGGDLDLTATDMANVTIRDRTPSTNPGELRGKALASMESSSGSSDSTEHVLSDNTPESMDNMIASFQSVITLLPALADKMNHLTLQVEREHEQVQAKFESLQHDFSTLRQENSGSGLDEAGSIGSYGNTPHDLFPDEEGATQAIPTPETGGGRETESSNGPLLEVKALALQSIDKPKAIVKALTLTCSSVPGDNDPDDDETVKSQGPSKMVMQLVHKRSTPSRKSLIPATTPEGGEDSTKTDRSLDDRHRRFPENLVKARKYGSTVFKEANEQRTFIRIAGAGFTNLCNIGLVFERNLSIMPLRSIQSIFDDSLHQASGSHATIRSQLHGNEIKIPELSRAEQQTRLFDMHKCLRQDAIEAGHSETFICTPPTKFARLLEVFKDDQSRVSQTILTIAQAVHVEQEQDIQLHVNGIGTKVSKLETLSHYEQTESFNSDTRASSTAADLFCGVKYEGFLARQELQEPCNTMVVIGSVQAKRLLLDITNPDTTLINPEDDGFVLSDMYTVFKKLEDCYINPAHCFMLTMVHKVKLSYAVMFTHFCENFLITSNEYMPALQLAFGSHDGKLSSNELINVLDTKSQNADRVYREVTIDDKINVLIGGRTIRTLDDHIDYVTHLSILKLWTATSETHQLLESYENSSVNVAQSKKEKSNRTRVGFWSVTQQWVRRMKNKIIGIEQANNRYTMARDMLLAKQKDENPRYPKRDWAIPTLRKLNGTQAELLQQHTGLRLKLNARAFSSDLMNETIVAYWIVTVQAATMHLKQKGEMMDTAAATDQLNSDEPTGMEEASEQPNSECVMVHDDTDTNTMVIRTVNLFTQALVIERNILTLNNIRTDVSKDGDDEEQSIGGADESLSMKNPDRRMH